MILPSSCSLYLQSLCATNITLNTFQHHSTPFSTYILVILVILIILIILILIRLQGWLKVSLGQGCLQVMTIQPANSISWSGGVSNAQLGRDVNGLVVLGKISPETMVSTINSIGASGFNVPIIQFCVFFFFVRWLIDVGCKLLIDLL